MFVCSCACVRVDERMYASARAIERACMFTLEVAYTRSSAVHVCNSFSALRTNPSF